jgi:putative salt-induced outer membrane protein YdiY
VKLYPPSYLLVLWFLTASCKVFAFTTVSQTKIDKKQLTEETIKVWEYPTPVFEHQFDWILLESNEWLKGNIISVYDNELEFDSEEFNMQTFDMDDIKELRSRYNQSIRLRDGTIVEGFVILQDGVLKIISDGKELTYPISELFNLTSSSEIRLSLWDGNISLGLNFLQGNVGQKALTLSATMQRRTSASRLKFDYLFNYSVLEEEGAPDVINANSSRFNNTYDWLYSEKIFFRVVDLKLFQDEIQNIESRNTLGSSLGYHIIDSPVALWDLTVGPSYQETKYTDSLENESEKSPVLSIHTFLEYEIMSNIDFVFDYQFKFVNEASGKRLHNLKTGLSFDLAYDIDIDFTMYVDRIAEPLPKADNTTPEENNFRTVVGLSYKF